MSSKDKEFVRQLMQLIDKFELRHLITSPQTDVFSSHLEQSPIPVVIKEATDSTVELDDDV